MAVEGFEVTVLSRERITTFPKLGQPAIQFAVTYVSMDLPPQTIWIPAADVDAEDVALLSGEVEARKGSLFEEFLKLEQQRIRADVERRLKAKPESYRV